MTLSACGDGEFTCQDGTCIALEKRCNLKLECPDQSDESECTLIDVPTGYKNTIPPPPTQPPKPLYIHFSTNIISFPAIRTQDLTFETSIELHLRWRDQRLTYQNLKRDRSLNLLSFEQAGIIWTPKLFFANAFGNVYTNLKEGSKVECIPEGKSSPGPRSNNEESTSS
ncbi:UNVERIFIED_CONTAM: hypothetical protein GTU68_026898 [Idotea baltica]|nr:hypothetical protein [Idotea baltica]